MLTHSSYTAHMCPWAHRAHIALAELGLEFEEVLIDLTKPREPWYLQDVNPRGLVPALKYGDQVIIESAIVAQFLADLQPSHLQPDSGTPSGALARARMAMFVETFISRVGAHFTGMVRSSDAAANQELADKLVAAVKADIAPLLADAAPFFGGAKEMTMAEVQTASFVAKFYFLGKKEHGLLPESLLDGLRGIEVWQRWVDAVLAKESVTAIFDEQAQVERFKTFRATMAKK
ncbi:putative glutathione S-transferase [Geopyxis carbonaria]|nr:putative glutathione S-transferase [Geopyxis carbonaria]